MNKKTISLFATMACLSMGFQVEAAANKPYPQYVHKSGTPEQDFWQENICFNALKYGQFVKNYIKPHADIPGALYVEGHITGSNPDTWPSGIKAVSASEHTGYGMILSALMDGYAEYKDGECLLGLGPVDYKAKEVFDGLFKLYKALPTNGNGKNLMSWIVPSKYKDSNGNKLETSSSASDGDFDVAYGLILAHQQWGDAQYKEAAIAIINDILKYDISTKGLILAGNWAESNGTVSRSSDWSFGHLDAFNAYVPSSRWQEIREYNQDAMLSVAHPDTGLTPDFLEYTGGGNGRPLGPVYSCEHFPTQHFSENASRLPWRLAVDYLHTGDTVTKNQLKKISTWIKDKVFSPSGTHPNFFDWREVKDTYKLDGSNFSWSSLPTIDPETGATCSYTPEDEAEGLSKGTNINRLNFMGPMVTSVLAGGDSTKNRMALVWGLQTLSQAEESSDDKYFGDSIRLLSLLTATQTWWNPATNYSGTGAYNANTGETFTSLQEAINNADNNGNLIQVSQNAISGNVAVTKNNLTIEGILADGSLPVFDMGSGSAITIMEGVENTVISNLSISNYDYGIKNRGKNSIIDKVIFQDIDEDAVQDLGSGKTEVRNSEFNDVATGIYSNKNDTSATVIFRNKFRNNYYDIYVEGSNEVKIYHNTMHDGAYGIVFDYVTAPALVVNNIFEWKYRPAVVYGLADIVFNSNLFSGNTFNTLPSGFVDSNLVIADPELNADLVPGNAYAIDNGAENSDGYLLTQGKPDIGAVEVSSGNDNTNTAESWDSNTMYQNGDVVSHLGRLWLVIGSFSAPGWEPGNPVLWAVWEDIGPA